MEFVTDFIQAGITRVVDGAVIGAGGFAGDIVSGVGDTIERSGRGVGNRIAEYAQGWAESINSYGDSVMAASGAGVPKRPSTTAVPRRSNSAPATTRSAGKSKTDVKQSQKQIGPQSAQRLLPAPAGSKTAYKASHSPYSKTPVAEKASSASRPAAAKPATPPYKPRAAGKGVDFLAIEGKGDKSKGSVASSKGVDFLGIGDKAAATKPSTNRSTTGPSKYQPSTRRSASSSAGGSNASARPSTSKPVQFF